MVALPSWRRPRLVIPVASSARIWSATRFYPAYRWTGRLFHAGLRLRALVRHGSATVPEHAAGQPLREFLAEEARGASVAAVQLGMPGGAQKLTAQLVDASGRIIGYLKCAEQPLARERLRHEHELLGALPDGAGPEPLAYGALAGLEVMLLAPVHGRHPPSALVPSPALLDFARSLTTAERHPLEEHPWYRARAMSLAELAPHFDALASRSWPVAITHGDLAPWNLLQTATGALLALDWEYGTKCGFPGLDLAQYVLQVALLLARRRPDLAREDAASALAIIETPPLSAPERDALVAIAARVAHDAAACEGLSDDDPRQRWRRAVWSHGRG